MLTLVHIIGQILFGGFFIYQAINHFSKSQDLTAYAASMKVPAPKIAVWGTGVLLLLGGVGVLFNFYTLIALILLAIFLISVTFTMHAFWNMKDPGIKASNSIQFWKNLALLGAVLLLMQW